MRPTAKVTLALLATLSTAPARAQSVAKQFGADVKNASLDIVDIWTSPFHARWRDWATAGGAVAVSAAFLPLDDNVDRWAVRNEHASEFSALKELRRGGAIYGGNRVMPYVGATYVVGLAIHNQNIRDGIFGCAASYASQSLVRTQIIYRVIGRRRPDATDVDSVVRPPATEGDQYDFSSGSSDWGQHSFPGGHVANLTACASFLSHRFHMKFVEPALYTVAAGVGVGRILDRDHWASDQVLGTLLGYAVGRQIAKRSLERAHPGSPTRSASSLSFSIIPERDRTTLSWTRVF